jgi:hypothetical protein
MKVWGRMHSRTQDFPSQPRHPHLCAALRQGALPSSAAAGPTVVHSPCMPPAAHGPAIPSHANTVANCLPGWPLAWFGGEYMACGKRASGSGSGPMRARQLLLGGAQHSTAQALSGLQAASAPCSDMR